MIDEPSGDDGADFIVRVAEGLKDIEPAVWDALADPGGTNDALPHPFTRHAFLSSLEDSGSVGGRTGWLPQHLLLEDADGQLLAAVPAYLKGHSQGEYVFDHGWADAFERAGGRYYPKLQVSVPFTPATGPRLLVGRGADATVLRGAMVSALSGYVRQTGVSSAHATFLQEADLEPMLEAGFLHRTDQQFHFVNRGYATYDDFLDTLASRKRKGLRKERREALASGITIERLLGSDISEEALDAFFAFYMDTETASGGVPTSTAPSSGSSQSAWPRRSSSSWHGAKGAISPERSTSSAATGSSGATGAARRTIRSSTSRSATTRPSTTRSSTSSPSSKRVRRASTSSRAAMSR